MINFLGNRFSMTTISLLRKLETDLNKFKESISAREQYKGGLKKLIFNLEDLPPMGPYLTPIYHIARLHHQVYEDRTMQQRGCGLFIDKS